MGTPWWQRWGPVWLVWLLILTGAYFGMGALLEQYQAPQSAHLSQEGRLVLKRSQGGHYWLKGEINGHSVWMLIDTGASSVSLSSQLADRLGLARGEEVRMNTANGVARAWETRLHTVALGDLQLTNVRAVIAENFGNENMVLIGMNVLGRLRVEIDDNTMTLSPRGSGEAG
ncbi:retropepsin-like aspartic protease family protein [Chitinimonas lacunae]|uniref:TIGR02281 family clan AA aspartic protease n=1 Tax=Chitinimonas lacunae TaxID=1963018 RepID=A0ABV8MVU0_9NEIS